MDDFVWKNKLLYDNRNDVEVLLEDHTSRNKSSLLVVCICLHTGKQTDFWCILFDLSQSLTKSIVKLSLRERVDQRIPGQSDNVNWYSEKMFEQYDGDRDHLLELQSFVVFSHESRVLRYFVLALSTIMTIIV